MDESGLPLLLLLLLLLFRRDLRRSRGLRLLEQLESAGEEDMLAFMTDG